MKKMPRLGQHFLTSQKAIHAIVESAKLTPQDTVLEIGPGKGVLTHALLECAGHVVAVEKDPNLVMHLRGCFKHYIERKKLTLVETDIRSFEPNRYKLQNAGYKLVANIPYYITGELLRTFLSGKTHPSCIVFLVQKEVAERIARSEKESILSLSVKTYGTPNYIQTVPKDAFSPPPQVDSAILLIDNISRQHFKNVDEVLFFKFVKVGFSQKRKLLRSNLRTLVPPETLDRIFQKLKIEELVRAEDVSLEQWLSLTRTLQSHFENNPH